MKILLINDNPVVSRLLDLCTREEGMLLDEVSSVSLVETNDYNILFVDKDAYSADVSDLLEDEGILKKVLFGNKNESITGFDEIIEKPFLPSQIIKILEGFKQDIQSIEKAVADKTADKEDLDVDENTITLLDDEDKTNEKSVSEQVVKEEVIIDDSESIAEKNILALLDNDEKDSEETVLDGVEVEKIKALLSMDDEAPKNEVTLSDEEYEKRKIEVIKEQLIADGLEIVEEDAIVEELSSKEIMRDSDDEVTPKKSKSKKSKKKKSKKKKINFSEDELERIEDAVEVAIATLKRKQMKKLLKGEEIAVSVKLEDF